ncbi:MAG: sugar phosphate isomerase/epimerase [Anaerolineaceae bacterium]|nr:sugar phosphate isomerase/epimerase [Anaerolineaceae bacterium]
MLHAGLVSITFRQLEPARIVTLAQEAQLASIEWGGDLHAPPGDERRARQLASMTRDAGLLVSAYGSYFRLRDEAEEEAPFEAVLATALALGAPVIRVWAGDAGPDATSPGERERIMERARRVCALASAVGTSVDFEFHRNTLTETSVMASLLLREVKGAGVYWQPRNGWLPQENLLALEAVSPRLGNVHCFHWWPTSRDRLPLRDGEADWRLYLDRLAALPGERQVSLEFVRDESPEQFLRDAATLRAWLTRYA